MGFLIPENGDGHSAGEFAIGRKVGLFEITKTVDGVGTEAGTISEGPAFSEGPEVFEAVVEGDGAGAVLAQVPGYHVGGKTGTAYNAIPGGYDRHRYMSTFVGIAPISDPQYVVAVDIRDPKGLHFAAQVSAPVFSKVMSGVLRIMNVPPDKR